MIPDFNTVRGADPRERFHYRGRYVIRLERRGGTFLYEVLTKDGSSISAGFDLLSIDEQSALEGITDRLNGKAKAA
jgi:hypothetical protein